MLEVTEVTVTFDINHFIDLDADYTITVGSWSCHMCAYKHAVVKWEREGISRWVLNQYKVSACSELITICLITLLRTKTRLAAHP